MTSLLERLRNAMNEDAGADGRVFHPVATDALPAVVALVEAARDLVEDYEESDPYPTSDRHPLYAARAALAPFVSEATE